MTSRYLEPVLGLVRGPRPRPALAGPGSSAWSVMVSEIMLQQTPVSAGAARVPGWLARWPTPAALAADPPGEAVRHGAAWLPAPRPAAARGGPDRDRTARRGHPGLLRRAAGPAGGRAYTAAAIASFAYRQRHPVLDTNVRRVLTADHRSRVSRPGGVGGRVAAGRDAAAGRARGGRRWAVGVMELGALVCTAARPGARCARWRRTAAGSRRAARPQRSGRWASATRAPTGSPGPPAGRAAGRHRAGPSQPPGRGLPRVRTAAGPGPGRPGRRRPGRRPPHRRYALPAYRKRRPDREVWAPLRTYCLALGCATQRPRPPFAAAGRLDLGSRRGVGHRRASATPVKVNFAVGPRPRRRPRRSTRTELAEQDLLRQRVLDLALDRAAQRPRTEHRVVTPLAQQLLGAPGAARYPCHGPSAARPPWPSSGRRS